MKSFVKKDSLLKSREAALKKILKKEKFKKKKEKMTVLSDKWIKKTVKAKGMINPFVNKQVRKGKISYGLSSYGYDTEFLMSLKFLPM